jgi:predicted metalloendopeptidase
MGANPEHVVTWKTLVMELTPYAEIMPFMQKWDDDLMALQAMDLESYKQAAYDIFLESTVKEIESTANKTAEAIYDDYCNYEKNRVFAERYLTPAMIERTKEICLELKQTFANRLNRCTWIGAASKASALEKLDAMEFYIGKPDYWIEEAMPNLSASQSLAEDQLLLSKSRHHFETSLIGKPRKGNAFSYLILNNSMNLYEVNSAYMPGFNAMMIMPTMMMPPFMPNDANEAIIYATATIFGHEMTHGFDVRARMNTVWNVSASMACL